MTPKEKAQNIVDQVMDYTPVNYPDNCTTKEANEIALADLNISKEIAKIAVYEITLALKSYGENNMELQNMDSELRYWDEVYDAIATL